MNYADRPTTLHDARVPIQVGARILKTNIDEQLTPDILENIDASSELVCALVGEISARLLSVLKAKDIPLNRQEESTSRHKIEQYLLLSVFISSVIKSVMGEVGKAKLINESTNFSQLIGETIREATKLLQAKYHELQEPQTIEEMRLKVVMRVLYLFYFGTNPTSYQRMVQGLSSGINITMRLGSALPALAKRDIPDVELTEELLMELYEDLFPIVMKVVFFSIPQLVEAENKISMPDEVMGLLKIESSNGARQRVVHQYQDFKRVPPENLIKGPPIGCPAHAAGVQNPEDDSAVRTVFDACGTIVKKAYARGIRK